MWQSAQHLHNKGHYWCGTQMVPSWWHRSELPGWKHIFEALQKWRRSWQRYLKGIREQRWELLEQSRGTIVRGFRKSKMRMGSWDECSRVSWRNHSEAYGGDHWPYHWRGYKVQRWTESICLRACLWVDTKSGEVLLKKAPFLLEEVWVTVCMPKQLQQNGRDQRSPLYREERNYGTRFERKDGHIDLFMPQEGWGSS